MFFFSSSATTTTTAKTTPTMTTSASMTNAITTTIHDLPEDVLYGVFDQLSIADLGHCASVCSSWRNHLVTSSSTPSSSSINHNTMDSIWKRKEQERDWISTTTTTTATTTSHYESLRRHVIQQEIQLRNDFVIQGDFMGDCHQRPWLLTGHAKRVLCMVPCFHEHYVLTVSEDGLLLAWKLPITTRRPKSSQVLYRTTTTAAVAAAAGEAATTVPKLVDAQQVISIVNTRNDADSVFMALADDRGVITMVRIAQEEENNINTTGSSSLSCNVVQRIDTGGRISAMTTTTTTSDHIEASDENKCTMLFTGHSDGMIRAFPLHGDATTTTTKENMTVDDAVLSFRHGGVGSSSKDNKKCVIQSLQLVTRDDHDDGNGRQQTLLRSQSANQTIHFWNVSSTISQSRRQGRPELVQSLSFRKDNLLLGGGPCIVGERPNGDMAVLLSCSSTSKDDENRSSSSSSLLQIIPANCNSNKRRRRTFQYVPPSTKKKEEEAQHPYSFLYGTSSSSQDEDEDSMIHTVAMHDQYALCGLANGSIVEFNLDANDNEKQNQKVSVLSQVLPSTIVHLSYLSKKTAMALDDEGHLALLDLQRARQQQQQQPKGDVLLGSTCFLDLKLRLSSSSRNICYIPSRRTLLIASSGFLVRALVFGDNQ